MSRPKPSEESHIFVSGKFYEELRSKLDTYPRPKYTAKLGIWLKHFGPSTGSISQALKIIPPLEIRVKNREPISFAPKSESEIAAYHKFVGKHFPKEQPKGTKPSTAEAHFKTAHQIEFLMFNNKLSIGKAELVYSNGNASNERKARRSIKFVKDFRVKLWRRKFNLNEDDARQIVDDQFGCFKENRKKPGQFRSRAIEFELSQKPWTWEAVWLPS